MESKLSCRYFNSYSGVKLPLNLVNELDGSNLKNRITYFRGYYDTLDRLKILEKVVYGEIEFTHHYEYSVDNVLEKAILTNDHELPRTMVFDSEGQPVEA